MKIYVAIAKNKKGVYGKFLPESTLSPRTDPGDLFKEAGENGLDFSTFDVAEFDLKKIKPSKILTAKKCGYADPTYPE